MFICNTFCVGSIEINAKWRRTETCFWSSRTFNFQKWTGVSNTGKSGQKQYLSSSHTARNYLVWVWHCVWHCVVVSVRERKCEIMCVCVTGFVTQSDLAAPQVTDMAALHASSLAFVIHSKRNIPDRSNMES